MLCISICLAVSAVKVSDTAGRMGCAQSHESWITHPLTKSVVDIAIAARTYLILNLLCLPHGIRAPANFVGLRGLAPFAPASKPNAC